MIGDIGILNLKWNFLCYYYICLGLILVISLYNDINNDDNNVIVEMYVINMI